MASDAEVAFLISGNSAGAVSAFNAVNDANKGMKPGLDENTNSSKELTGAVGQLSGALGSVSGEMGELVGKAGEFTKSVSEAAGEGGLAGLGGAATVAVGAFAMLGTSGGNLVTGMNQLASTLGTDIETADKLSLMFEDTGSNASVLTRISSSLNTVLGQANDTMAAGGELTGKAAILQKNLGIEITATSTSGDVLQQTLEKLGAMYANTATRQQALSDAAQLFGARIAGQLNPVLANYAELAAKAEQQSKLTAAGFEDGGQKAIEYNMALTDLKVSYDQFALSTLPAFTTTLKVVNDGWSLATSALNPAVIAYRGTASAVDLAKHSLDGFNPAAASATEAIGSIAGAAAAAAPQIDKFADSAGKAVLAFGALVQKNIDATVTKDEANRAQAEANRLMGIETDLEGKAVPTKQELINKAKDSTDATIANKAATDEAMNSLAMYGTEAEKAAARDYFLAQQKKELTGATKDHVATLQEDIDALYKQAAATDLQNQAQTIYNEQMGIAVDLEGRALPTMQDLVNAKLDAYNATLRDNEANREANAILGLQVDINGRVIKSFQQLVEEQKASILESQRMSAATVEANKELGITTTTATAASTSLTSLAASTTSAGSAAKSATDNYAALAKAMGGTGINPNGSINYGGTSGAGGTAAFSTGGGGSSSFQRANQGGLSGAVGGGGGTAAFVTVRRPSAPLVGSFARGTSSVPRTGLAYVHQGEKITPAGQNSGGPPIIINGDVYGWDDFMSKVSQAWVATALGGGFRGIYAPFSN